MKAVILARVSTHDQEEGHSLNAQLARLRDYCGRKGLDIIGTFEVIESSTRGKRKEFHEMISFVKKQPGTIAIVADKIDRVQRSFKESVLLDELIRSEKVELHFFSEGMIINKNASSMDFLRWDYGVVGARSYVLQLGENVKRSIEYKLSRGEIIGPAPIGYINVEDANSKKTVLVDVSRAYVIKKMFQEYATGISSLSEITRKASEWGLVSRKSGKHLTKSTVDQILQNTFYCGYMNIKGKRYPHKYEKIIDESLFNKCVQVRQSYGKKPFKSGKIPFIFRGVIKCAVSGRTVSSDMKKGKHIYLVCIDPRNPAKRVYVPEEKVLTQVKDVFKSLWVPDEVLEAIRNHLRDSMQAKKIFHDAAIRDLQSRYTQAQSKLDQLLEMRLEQSITTAEYDKKALQLKQSQYELNEQLKSHTKGDEQFNMTVSTLASILSRAHELFESSTIEQKRQLVNFVFSNLSLKGKKLEYSLRTPFNLFLKMAKTQEWLPGTDSNRRPSG